MSPPSHHGSPLGVIATFVKIVLSRIACTTLGFVFMPVPGATPKNPFSGLIARKYPSAPILQPCDVVAQSPHAIALAFERGNHHRHICFSARAWKRSGHVRHFAAGIFQAKNQHVLGHPALLARHPACDSQRETFFSEQRIAAVTRSVTPDQSFFGEVRDESPIRIEFADRMQPRHKIFGISQPIDRNFSHARHDSHARGHVCAVGDFHTHAALRRIYGAEYVRHHIHRPASHRAIKKRADFFLRVGRRHPVIRGAGRLFRARADKREMFRARHIVRIAAMKI